MSDIRNDVDTKRESKKSHAELFKKVFVIVSAIVISVGFYVMLISGLLMVLSILRG